MKLSKFAMVCMGLLALSLGGAPRLEAFLLWLDTPTRSNPLDPKSNAYKAPQATPYSYPTAYPSNTWTNTPPATNTPAATPSFSSTFTSSPAVSATFTPTSSPVLSATSTPTISPFSPTPTPLPTHGSLIADLENNLTQDRTLWNGAPILTVKDSLGSTLNPNPWGPSSGTLGGAYGTSSYSACISGNMLIQIPPSQYPYCFIAFELIPSGSAPPSSGGVDTDITPYSPNLGLKFDYKAGAAGVLYRVKLISTLVTDFGYYEWNFTSADAAWHTATVYFPGTPGATNVFAQPGWGAARPFDSTKIGAVMFEPVPQASTAVAYNLCVDNLTFAVAALPTPNPTPTFGTGTMVANFENNSANDVTLAPFSQAISIGSDAASTVAPKPWTASSGTAPGSNASGPASSYAGCYSGTLIAQNPAGGVYPYGVMELLLAPSGWGNGGGAVDVTPYAPSKRVIFDYKAGAAGVQYGIQIITSNVTDYGFYEYVFTPADTNWHTQVVYFPDAAAAYTPKFAQPGWCAVKPWNAALAGEFLIRAVPVTGSPVTFSICIDNLRFD